MFDFYLGWLVDGYFLEWFLCSEGWLVVYDVAVRLRRVGFSMCYY